MANRNWSSGGKLYSMHTQPVMVTCSFTVDAANTNGLGIKNLQGPTIAHVFMNSSAATPSTLPGANPASGSIVVQLQDNYNQLLDFTTACQSPNSGSDIKVDNSAMTIGVPYVITTLGNTTTAQWQTLGVPTGVTPAVGVAFIAKLIGVAGEANTSTSRVQIAAAAGSGIFSIEMVGNPNTSIAPNPTANQGYGAQFILECRKDSAADAPAVQQPTDGTTVYMQLLLSNSSVQQGLTQGE